MAGTGFERQPFPPGNGHIASTGAATSAAPDAANGGIDPALREVIEAWPELPAAIKTGIVAMMRAAWNGRGRWRRLVTHLRTVRRNFSHPTCRRARLDIGGVWIRQPVELHMKRSPGLLLGMGMVGCSIRVPP